MKNLKKIVSIVILMIIGLKIQNTQYSRKLTIRVNKIRNPGSMYNNGICVKPKKANSSICEAVFLCVGYEFWNARAWTFSNKFFIRTPVATDEYSFTEPGNYFETLIPNDRAAITFYLIECNNEKAPNTIGRIFDFWVKFQIINLNCIPCMDYNNFAEFHGNIHLKNLYKAFTYRSIGFILENLSMKNFIDLFSMSCNKKKCDSNRTALNCYVNDIREYPLTYSNFNLHSLTNSVMIFSNEYSQWFGKNGIRIKIALSREYDNPEILGIDEIIVAKIASPFHSLVLEKNFKFQTDPIKITIQTFSTNYVGDNLEQVCPFKNKDTVCGNDGNYHCVRKYNKILDENCKVIDPCLTNKCQNSAKCKRISRSYVCVCALGSSGKFCEKLYCNRNCDICQINKICHLCKKGLEGNNCSIKSCKNFDCGFGQCQLINNTRSCLCRKGIFGEKCNDTCSTDCKNGVCDLYNGYLYCKCYTGYIGINCNIKDSTYPIIYSKSDKFIYTLASITIIITFIIIIIFILLLRFNPNRESDDQDTSTYFVTQAGINQTEMINEGESNSVKKNVNESPDFIYEFNIAEKLKERVKKQELSEHNSEKDSSKEEKISTITDASKNIIYDTRYE